MTFPVYSTKFISHQGLNGDGTLVTVPPGLVYSIKQLTWYSNPILEPSRGFFMDADTGATLFSCATQGGTPAWFGFYGELVFEEGQSFFWRVSAGPGDAADVSAHGYSLSKTT